MWTLRNWVQPLRLIHEFTKRFLLQNPDSFQRGCGHAFYTLSRQRGHSSLEEQFLPFLSLTRVMPDFQVLCPDLMKIPLWAFPQAGRSSAVLISTHFAEALLLFLTRVLKNHF